MKPIFSLALALCFVSAAQAQNWPSFRGQNASGVTSGATEGGSAPTAWDAEKSVNIQWKTPIPGVGHSSPIVWGNRVFITTAISSDQSPVFERGPSQSVASATDTSKHVWRVYCLDKTNGRVVWAKTAHEGVPKTKRHVRASHANPTPATDGKHVVAFFGSEGLYCYDFNGTLLWKHDLGVLDGGWSPDPKSHWGFSSSPVIYRHLALVQCDTQRNSFIAAYNLKDGREVWRVARDEDTSWSSPTIYEAAGRAELIVSGTKHYRGYDPLTGKELWRLADGADVKIPAPVAAHGLIFLGGGSSHMRRSFYAVRAGARGEIALRDGAASNEQIAWRNRATPHILTPIVYGDYLYVCGDNGVLTQYQAGTGEEIYRERIGGRGVTFSASPIAADGKLYFASEDGDIFVVKAGPNYELLARNPMGEVLMATPAISDGLLIVRGQRHVFGIR
ncbi:MAG: PQQ-binding-like beta-propeller repeat protein [Blastocatellales bacterium]